MGPVLQYRIREGTRGDSIIIFADLQTFADQRPLPSARTTLTVQTFASLTAPKRSTHALGTFSHVTHTRHTQTLRNSIDHCLRARPWFKLELAAAGLWGWAAAHMRGKLS